jgi:hypothetical protein
VARHHLPAERPDPHRVNYDVQYDQNPKKRRETQASNPMRPNGYPSYIDNRAPRNY